MAAKIPVDPNLARFAGEDKDTLRLLARLEGRVAREITTENVIMLIRSWLTWGISPSGLLDRRNASDLIFITEDTVIVIGKRGSVSRLSYDSIDTVLTYQELYLAIQTEQVASDFAELDSERWKHMVTFIVRTPGVAEAVREHILRRKGHQEPRDVPPFRPGFFSGVLTKTGHDASSTNKERVADWVQEFIARNVPNGAEMMDDPFAVALFRERFPDNGAEASDTLDRPDAMTDWLWARDPGWHDSLRQLGPMLWEDMIGSDSWLRSSDSVARRDPGQLSW